MPANGERAAAHLRHEHPSYLGCSDGSHKDVLVSSAFSLAVSSFTHFVEVGVAMIGNWNRLDFECGVKRTVINWMSGSKVALPLVWSPL